MEIRNIHIYLYVCMYVSFSMVRSHARLRITLTARRTTHFTRVGVSLTNPADSSIAHTPWKKKEKAGMGERSQTESVRNTKKSKVWR